LPDQKAEMQNITITRQNCSKLQQALCLFFPKCFKCINIERSSASIQAKLLN
jgi:hypothetical protein